jgi:hypothetical protein
VTEQADIVGPASLFNSYVADWGSRVNSFINYLIIVSGGILSITVGAFLTGHPPALTQSALLAVQRSWLLLSVGLVLALLTAFLHIAAQAFTIARWRKQSVRATSPRLLTITAPSWLRIATWVVFGAAFACCAAGIVCISVAAAQLLHIRP